MDCIQRLENKKAIQTVRAFIESSWFSVAFGVAVFLFYALNIPVVTLGIFAVCGIFICLFCEDTRPGLSLVLLIMFSFRYRDNGRAYLSTGAIILYVAAGIPLLAAIFYRWIKRSVPMREKVGLCCMTSFAVAVLLGGVFTKYYTASGFAYAFAIACALFFCYLYFACTLKRREDNLLYLARVLAVGVCVIALELLEFYLREYEWGTPLDYDWKGAICLGWSRVSNMVAEMIVFALPAVFYLIYKEKYGYWYWLVVAIGLIAIYFTFGRNAILGAAATVLVGTVLNCFYGKHKRINRILVLLAFLVAVGALVALYREGYLAKLMQFFLDTGLRDRGRFSIWETHLELFEEYPVFGAGFDAYEGMEGVSKAHNNLVQMLSSTGLIGLGLYLTHRVQTVYTLVKKPTIDRLFIGGCIGVALFMGMLSSTFFHIYSIVHYSVILLVLEKSGEE